MISSVVKTRRTVFIAIINPMRGRIVIKVNILGTARDLVTSFSLVNQNIKSNKQALKSLVIP